MRFRSVVEYTDVDTGEILHPTKTELKQYRIVGTLKTTKRINEWITEITYNTLITKTGTQLTMNL